MNFDLYNWREYQGFALRTEKTPVFWCDSHQKSRFAHGVIGICTEIGELQDQLKRHVIYGKELDPVNVMEEAGDLLWYIALVLDASGYTMEQAMERNIAKLARRYGEKFSEVAALNRDLEAERAALALGEAEKLLRAGVISPRELKP